MDVHKFEIFRLILMDGMISKIIASLMFWICIDTFLCTNKCRVTEMIKSILRPVRIYSTIIKCRSIEKSINMTFQTAIKTQYKNLRMI